MKNKDRLNREFYSFEEAVITLNTTEEQLLKYLALKFGVINKSYESSRYSHKEVSLFLKTSETKLSEFLLHKTSDILLSIDGPYVRDRILNKYLN